MSSSLGHNYFAFSALGNLQSVNGAPTIFGYAFHNWVSDDGKNTPSNRNLVFNNLPGITAPGFSGFTPKDVLGLTSPSDINLTDAGVGDGAAPTSGPPAILDIVAYSAFNPAPLTLDPAETDVTPPLTCAAFSLKITAAAGSVVYLVGISTAVHAGATRASNASAPAPDTYPPGGYFTRRLDKDGTLSDSQLNAQDKGVAPDGSLLPNRQQQRTFGSGGVAVTGRLDSPDETRIVVGDAYINEFYVYKMQAIPDQANFIAIGRFAVAATIPMSPTAALGLSSAADLTGAASGASLGRAFVPGRGITNNAGSFIVVAGEAATPGDISPSAMYYNTVATFSLQESTDPAVAGVYEKSHPDVNPPDTTSPGAGRLAKRSIVSAAISKNGAVLAVTTVTVNVSEPLVYIYITAPLSFLEAGKAKIGDPAFFNRQWVLSAILPVGNESQKAVINQGYPGNTGIPGQNPTDAAANVFNRAGGWPLPVRYETARNIFEETSKEDTVTTDTDYIVYRPPLASAAGAERKYDSTPGPNVDARPWYGLFFSAGDSARGEARIPFVSPVAFSDDGAEISILKSDACLVLYRFRRFAPPEVAAPDPDLKTPFSADENTRYEQIKFYTDRRWNDPLSGGFWGVAGWVNLGASLPALRGDATLPTVPRSAEIYVNPVTKSTTIWAAHSGRNNISGSLYYFRTGFARNAQGENLALPVEPSVNIQVVPTRIIAGALFVNDVQSLQEADRPAALTQWGPALAPLGSVRLAPASNVTAPDYLENLYKDRLPASG